MEVFCTEQPCKKSDRPLSTGRAFRGRQYERTAVVFCRRRNYKILKKNLRLKGGEIDCLAWDEKRKTLILIEVRGRETAKRLPSRFLSREKRERLKHLGRVLAFKKKCSVRLYLLEVIGRIPHPSLCWGIELFPERLGLQMKAYELSEY